MVLIVMNDSAKLITIARQSSDCETEDTNIPFIFNHPTLKAIAQGHGKSVGQVILRWLNQRNVVVIPKTVRKERMAENLDIFDFTLSDTEMSAIAALDTGTSLIHDVMDLATVKFISTYKIHD